MESERPRTSKAARHLQGSCPIPQDGVPGYFNSGQKYYWGASERSAPA